RISYELYPSGIICRIPWRAPRYIAWDQISEIRGGQRKLSAYHPHAPVVVAELTDRSAPPQHQLFDRTGELGIPAAILRCDSNLLLTVIRHLHLEPSARRLLATETAPRWLTPSYHNPRR